MIVRGPAAGQALCLSSVFPRKAPRLLSGFRDFSVPASSWAPCPALRVVGVGGAQEVISVLQKLG